jgi:predicted enzyme related to lactoylglutathione lyase
MDHLTNWLEIPVVDMERARRFYEKVLGVELMPMELPGMRYAIFPAKNAFNTGALVQGEGYAPASGGPVVYLDAQDRIDAVLARVTEAGGSVAMPKMFLSPEAGEIAFFVDSEGNRIGLQSSVNEAKNEPVTDETMQRLLGGADKNVTFLLRRGPAFDDPARQHLQWEHARNMFSLLRAGKLRMVTALMDGTDVLGVAIFNGTREEAEATLREDPGVRGGRLNLQLLTGVSFFAGETRF